MNNFQIWYTLIRLYNIIQLITSYCFNYVQTTANIYIFSSYYRLIYSYVFLLHFELCIIKDENKDLLIASIQNFFRLLNNNAS